MGTFYYKQDNFQIRPAKQEDLEQIAKFVGDLYYNEARYGPRTFPVDMDRLILKDVEDTFSRVNHQLIVAEYSTLEYEVVVGFTHVIDRENSDYTVPVHSGYLCELWVDENHRSLGGGTLLIKAAIQWCKERGLPEIGLSVHINNIHAAQLYDRHGFQSTYTFMERSI